MKSKIFIILFILVLLSGCQILVPNVEVCHVYGTINGGSGCEFTNSGKQRDIDFYQTLDFIQPLPPYQTDPGHGAAIFMSAESYSRLKTSVSLMCRKLGKLCVYEME